MSDRVQSARERAADAMPDSEYRDLVERLASAGDQGEDFYWYVDGGGYLSQHQVNRVS